MKHSRYYHRCGLSLVEVVVSSLLVGTVVVGALTMLSATVRSQSICNDLSKGPNLADSLLAEIMSLPYEDPEGGTGLIGLDANEPVSIFAANNRMQFDDVDDYHGWNPVQPKDRTGSVLLDYSGWRRQVVVTWNDQNNGGLIYYESGLKRILVMVTSPPTTANPAGVVTKRFGFRSSNGSLEQSQLTTVVAVSQIEATLQVYTDEKELPRLAGDSAIEVRGITNLLNHVEALDAN